MKKQCKLAFSLIELSIVALIIAILIVGVTQGLRLVAQAKLKSAQSLTANLPAHFICELIIFNCLLKDSEFRDIIII